MKYWITGVLLFCACSPQARFNHLVKKYPHLITTRIVTYRDTLYRTDTLIKLLKVAVPGSKDRFIIKSDTTIETQELIVTKHDTIFDVVVKPKVLYVHDTFIKKDTIPIEIHVLGEVVHDKIPWERIVAGIAFFLILILLLVWFIRRRPVA